MTQRESDHNQMDALRPPVRILIVDDSDVRRRAIVRLLKSVDVGPESPNVHESSAVGSPGMVRSCEVLEAKTGAEGLRMAKAENPDLMLLDVVLPDISGVELCRRIKAEPVLEDSYIVLISSMMISSDNQAEGLEAGAEEYIPWPMPNREFLARVRAIMRLKLADQARVDELAETKATLRVEAGQRLQAEERLRLLSAVVEQTHEGVAVTDMAGDLLFVNRAFAAAHGYTPDDLVGAHLSVFHTAEQAAVMEKANRQLRETGEFNGEIWHVRRDGTVFPALMHNSLLRDADSVPIGMIITLRDITDLQQAQEALQHAHDELEMRVAARTVDLRMTNSQLQQEIAERTRAEEALAWEASINAAIAELSRSLISLASLDEISALVLEHAKQLTGSVFGFVGYIDVKTGCLISPTLTRDVWDSCQIPDKRFVFESFGGLWGWVLEHREPVLTNTPQEDPRSSGVPQGHIAIRRFLSAPALIGETLVGQIALANPGRDYVEQDLAVVERLATLYALAVHRSRAEMALRESEETYHNLFEYANDAIFIVDPETRRFLDVNQNAARRLGYTREELLGSGSKAPISLDDIAPPETFDRDEVLRALYENGDVIFEHKHRRKDGTEIPVETSSHIIEYRGQQAFQSFTRDITERKRAEKSLARYAAELKRSNQELEQFAYVVSHDLQEPLRMVTSYLKLLERRYEDKLDESAEKFIWFAVDGATRMQQMIKALLTYARVDTRGKALVPTDCEEVLERVLRNLQTAIRESNAVVTHAPLPEVLADPVQLEQVFQNLIANALKFQPQDNVPEVHISATQVGDEMWRFAVQDNGIGIDVDQAAHLFQVFRRLHTRAEYEGTGIGLATCRKIVERHGGRIGVESEPGEGALFWFTLPGIEKRIDSVDPSIG
jgi:PAS domain S-box-containing protein